MKRGQASEGLGRRGEGGNSRAASLSNQVRWPGASALSEACLRRVWPATDARDLGAVRWCYRPRCTGNGLSPPFGGARPKGGPQFEGFRSPLQAVALSAGCGATDQGGGHTEREFGLSRHAPHEIDGPGAVPGALDAVLARRYTFRRGSDGPSTVRDASVQ